MLRANRAGPCDWTHKFFQCLQKYACLRALAQFRQARRHSLLRVRLNSVGIYRLRSFAVNYVPLTLLFPVNGGRRSQFLAMHVKYEQAALANASLIIVSQLVPAARARTGVYPTEKPLVRRLHPRE